MSGFSAKTINDILEGLRTAVTDDTPRWVMTMRPEAYAALLEARRRQAWIPVLRRRRAGVQRIGLFSREVG